MIRVPQVFIKDYQIGLVPDSTYSNISVKVKLSEKTNAVVTLSIAELDIFKGDLDSLKLVEVEFCSVEEANNFIPPEWFGKDVTTDGRYHNSYISKYGLLKWRY